MIASTQALRPPGFYRENAKHHSLVCGVAYKGDFTVCRGSRHLKNTRKILYRVVSKLQQFASTSNYSTSKASAAGERGLIVHLKP